MIAYPLDKEARVAVSRNAQRLAVALSRQLPDGAVSTDADVLAAYAADKSHAAPAPPDAVVRVRSEAEIAAVLRAAEQWEVPVVPRGAGTGKSGGAVAVCGGVVLDTTGMRTIVDIDADDLLAVVEPGVITGVLQQEVARHGLFYPPDPNSLDTCTIGGNVAHNAGGPRAFKYGVTREYVMGLRAVLMGGTAIQTGVRTVKGVAGYDLTRLLVGSEGTLGVVSQVTVRLRRDPAVIHTLLVPMPSEEAAGALIAATVASGLVPRVMEFLDANVVAVLRRGNVTHLPAGTGALLLVEMDGFDEAAVESDTVRFADLCDAHRAVDVLVARHAGERERLWEARRLMSETLAETAAHKVSEDIVVPRSQAPALLTAVKKLADRYGVRVAAYGHGGDGNYHINVLWDDPDFAPDALVRDLFAQVLSLGGTITGEHGVGITKRPYLPMEQDAAVRGVYRAIKESVDPHGLLNPGKIF